MTASARFGHFAYCRRQVEQVSFARHVATEGMHIKPFKLRGPHFIRGPKYKYVLVAAARWEEEHICEWVAYHASIGYDHVYLYSNDDDPLRFYQAIQPYLVGRAPFVTYYHCATPGVQRRMFMHFLERHGHEAEWISFFDIDEFLRIPGFGSVDAFVKSYPRDTDSIYLNWAFFGNDGFKERPRGSVLVNYVRRQRGLDRHAKTITRRRSISRAFLAEAMENDLRFQHGWSGPLNDHMRRINVLGDDMADWYIDLDRANAYITAPDRAAAMYAVGVLHHYAMKSEADFMRRVRRGSHGDHSGQASWQTMWESGEWRTFLACINEVVDRSLQDYWMRRLASARRKM